MDVYALRERLIAITEGRMYVRKHEDGLATLAFEQGVPEHLLAILVDRGTEETTMALGFHPESDYVHRQIIGQVKNVISEITRTDDETLHHLPLAHMISWLAVVPTPTLGDLRNLIETVQAWGGIDQAWVYHAAGLTRAEYDASSVSLADAQVLAALRGYPDLVASTA